MPSPNEPLDVATVDKEWRNFFVFPLLAMAVTACGIVEVVLQALVHPAIESYGNDGPDGPGDNDRSSTRDALWAALAQLFVSCFAIYLLRSAKMNKSNPIARVHASLWTSLIALFAAAWGLGTTYDTCSSVLSIKDDPNASCFYYQGNSNIPTPNPDTNPLCKGCSYNSTPSQPMCCCCSGSSYHGNGSMAYYGVSSCEIVFGWIFRAELASVCFFGLTLATICAWSLFTRNCNRNPRPLCGPRWWPQDAQATTRLISNSAAARQPNEVHVQRDRPRPPNSPGYGATAPASYQQRTA